jgi:hypothetical protein
MQEALEIAVLTLSPIIPHVTHALWRVGQQRRLIDEPWPAVDAQGAATATVEMVVQVNGKLRGRIVVAVDAARAPCAPRRCRRQCAEIHRRRGGPQGDRRARQARQRRGVGWHACELQNRAELAAPRPRLALAPAAFGWWAAIRCRPRWRGRICR